METTFKNPGDEGFVPYYERRGVGARGVADQWLNWYRQQEQKTYKAASPALRDSIQSDNDEWVRRQYMQLRQFEEREVRKGEMDTIEQTVANRSNSTVESILAQIRAEDEWGEGKTFEIATTRAGDAAMNGDEGLARHDEHLKVVKADLDAQTDSHIDSMLADIEDFANMYDVAASKAIFTPEDAIVRKRMSGGATYCNAVKSLVASGHDRAAEKFIDRIDDERDDEGKLTGKRNAIAEKLGITSKDISEMRDGVRRVRERKAAEAQRLIAARETAAKEAAREREIKLIQTPMSGNGYADDEQLACGYDELASDMQLPSETRLSYARTAASMRKAIARQKEAEKAERTRQDRAEKRETMREAKEIVAQRLERQFRDDLDSFKAGWTYDENGEAVDLTVYDMMDRAKRGLDSERYTVQQFRELMSVPERKWDEESEDLRDHVIAIARQITPYVVYNRQENRFAFRADRKTTSKSSSGIEFGTRGGTQQATYGQLIRALNLTLAAKKNSRMSAADAKRYFDEITAGTVRAQMQATIDENLDYDEQFINAFRSK